MTLESLQREMVKAMKDGDKIRKSVISTVIARIKNTAIDKGCRDNIPEDMVDAELLKAQKITQEMIDTCPVSRQDLLENYKNQMEIVCEFAPSLITNADEIRQAIYRLILDNGNELKLVKSNRGAIMKLVAANLNGEVDMSVASKVVGEMLE